MSEFIHVDAGKQKNAVILFDQVAAGYYQEPAPAWSIANSHPGMHSPEPGVDYMIGMTSEVAEPEK